MPPPRPRGIGYNTGVSSIRPTPNTPMSERQQMALLIQMTANNADLSRTQCKKNDQKKIEITGDNIVETPELPETFRDKHSLEDYNLDKKEVIDQSNVQSSNQTIINKRNYSDIDDDALDDDEETKKKKSKVADVCKDGKVTTCAKLPNRIEKNIKPFVNSKTCTNAAKVNFVEKEQNENKSYEIEDYDDDLKSSDSLCNGGLKVPPLKIVIPSQNNIPETDGLISRTGKLNQSRSSGLPYVVSSNNETGDKEVFTQNISPNESPHKLIPLCSVIDERNPKITSEEKNLQRVLRSSHRTGSLHTERNSNNSSPQMQSSSPSPAPLMPGESSEGKLSITNIPNSPMTSSTSFEHENVINLPSPSTSSTSSSKDTHAHLVEIHPRKRKLKTKNDETNIKLHTGCSHADNTSNTQDCHPHDLPFLNGFQMFLNIRKQIAKKWKNLYLVKPRPPQGFQDYLINKRDYLLSNHFKNTLSEIPQNVSPKMREIFFIQERERYELFQRQTVEREKLCLHVEQEIIRVHSKAARNTSFQSAPFSVCTLIKDDEIYNMMPPDQEEKDKNVRYRCNGRLLLSWLQDVDDKWEKVKEAMVLRHQNEAESLHAVQLMDWELALKKYELCDYKYQINIEKDHVPIVLVTDDFDLLPA